MANKFDIKTMIGSATVGASSCHQIGSAIPTGKTRFLTYIRVERAGKIATDTSVPILSVAVGSVSDSAAAHATALGVSNVSAGGLLWLGLAGITRTAANADPLADHVFINHIPDRPDVDHPILSLAGTATNFMMVGVKASGAAATIFAQYYDE